MVNVIKKGSLVRCLWGCGVLALALVASPRAGAADPSGGTMPSEKSGETGGSMPSASKTRTVHATATVAAIDKHARKVTIKRADGEKTSVTVPAEMKEFNKLKVGDKIDIDYTESVALEMLPPGTKPKIVAKEASIPGAAGRELAITAEVVSVDAANNKVTFKGPKGMMTTVDVEDPDLQARLPNLKPGQAIMIRYSEAVAAAIQPPSK